MLEYVVAIVVLLILYTVYLNNPPKGLPKGPFVWPFLGIFPQLWHYYGLQYWHLLFTEYAQKYGKIFPIRMATQPAVVICDVKLIKEAFNNPLLCGRAKVLSLAERTGGTVRGILFQDGEEWSEQRRFTLRHLRDFGFGKTSMENMILDEVAELVDRLKKEGGKPVVTQNRFNIAVLNALWTIISGERLKHDDPVLQEIIAAITRNVSGRATGVIGSFAPHIAKYAPKLIGWDEYKKDLSYVYDYLMDFTKKQLQSFDANADDEVENFSQVYIKEMRKTTDPGSSFYGKRGELTMTAVMQDLFVAGAETTSTTLTWACLYLAVYPEAQKKLQAEIDQILGENIPSLDDRARMPYIEAFTMETLRFSSMVPLGLVHRAMEDVPLGGHKIPKDTLIFANLHYVHHDPEIWGDPENFRPERFLSPDGSTVVKHDALMPFSYGKRLCLGESLAKNELFLFLTTLFKTFSVTWDPNGPKPGIDKVDGVVMSPKPHKLVFTERN